MFHKKSNSIRNKIFIAVAKFIAPAKRIKSPNVKKHFIERSETFKTVKTFSSKINTTYNKENKAVCILKTEKGRNIDNTCNSIILWKSTPVNNEFQTIWDIKTENYVEKKWHTRSKNGAGFLKCKQINKDGNKIGMVSGYDVGTSIIPFTNLIVNNFGNMGMHSNQMKPLKISKDRTYLLDKTAIVLPKEDQHKYIPIINYLGDLKALFFVIKHSREIISKPIENIKLGVKMNDISVKITEEINNNRKIDNNKMNLNVNEHPCSNNDMKPNDLQDFSKIVNNVIIKRSSKRLNKRRNRNVSIINPKDLIGLHYNKY